MENRHVDDLIDAYALGALEPDEVDTVERHLQRCETCRALADQARQYAEILLLGVPQVPPPPTLRGRVLARIAAEKAATSPDGQPSHASPSAEPGQIEPEREPEREPEPARGPLRRLLDALRNEPAPAGRAGDLLRELLADPEVVLWAAPGTNDAPGASGRLIASPRRREAVFVARGLRQPAAGTVYQVWLLRGGQPLPNSLFAVDRAGVGAGIVHADAPWHDFDTVAVTPEPRGGSQAPTGPIVLAGSLSQVAR